MHRPGGRPRGLGEGRSLTTARPRAAAPSLAPRAGAERGKRAGDPRGRGAATRPTPGTPATRKPGPPLHPAPGTRRSAPTSAAWRRGRGRGRDWWAGIRTTYWVGHWLRGSQQRSAIGCGDPVSVGAWGWEHVFLSTAPAVDLGTLVVFPKFFTKLAPGPAGNPL